MKKLNLTRAALSLALVFVANVSVAQVGSYRFSALEAQPGQGYSTASGLNDLGQVIGRSSNGGSVLWDHGIALDLSYGGSFYAVGINNAGQVTGTSSSFGSQNSAIWQDGRLTDLGSLYGFNGAGSGFAINNSGQVAGESGPAFGARHATLWNGSSIVDLGTLGGPISYSYSAGYGINDAGHVVGKSFTDQYFEHAALWKDGNAIDLGTLGGGNSVAYGINNADQVVGSAGTQNFTNHAVLWQNGQVIDLTIGLDGGSIAYAINNRGQVVGNLGNSAGFMWQNGVLTDLNSLLDAQVVRDGWHVVDARAINNNGAIIGDAINYQTGKQSAFILTPVPEPETWATLVLGLGALAWVARRRKAQA